ncbi:MAG: hypothetical protein KF855_07360 [Acidobacteria bacterium]|nr:hypothetical protein [Acidobacteriota bacterium]
MSSNWKRCPKGELTGRWASHYVTMNPQGFIVMSRKTHQSIKCAEVVHLYFDRINDRIGVRPADPRGRDVFRVAKQGRHGGRLIRAYRIMQEFGVELTQSVRFQDVEIDGDGILVLDLRTAKARTRKAPGGVHEKKNLVI